LKQFAEALGAEAFTCEALAFDEIVIDDQGPQDSQRANATLFIMST